jgi:hypothetical protein
MIDWFSDHKDAAIAIAALASPFVVMIGTLVAAMLSFKAITTAPRIQREIAQETARMTQEIARDTARRTQAQIRAGLYGAADHQWITDFRAAIAEVLALGNEIMSDRMRGSSEATLAFNRKYTIAVTQIRLMSWDDAEELRGLATEFVYLANQDAPPLNDTDLPTPRSTLAARYVRIVLTCRSCLHQVDADLEALIAAGRGDTPLVELRWRCGHRRINMICTGKDVVVSW